MKGALSLQKMKNVFWQLPFWPHTNTKQWALISIPIEKLPHTDVYTCYSFVLLLHLYCKQWNEAISLRHLLTKETHKCEKLRQITENHALVVDVQNISVVLPGSQNIPAHHWQTRLMHALTRFVRGQPDFRNVIWRINDWLKSMNEWLKCNAKSNVLCCH